ncbi:hypothetical protein SAMN04488689_110113 [Paenibacillus sp. cl6col]|nr:hypothetical protein SAMN04488689_110113 [Paenibacillus sp. cl6col]
MLIKGRSLSRRRSYRVDAAYKIKSVKSVGMNAVWISKNQILNVSAGVESVKLWRASLKVRLYFIFRTVWKAYRLNGRPIYTQ